MERQLKPPRPTNFNRVCARAFLPRVLRLLRRFVAGFALGFRVSGFGFRISRPSGLRIPRVCSGALCSLVVLAFGFGLEPEAAGQATIQTVLANGPISNRLNLVILSEGYTANQLAQFLVDATNAVNVLLSHPPYQEYRNYVNAFAIKVASTESGSDHPYYGQYRDTYFNSTYDSVADYLITIPAGSTGQGRVDALLADPYAPMRSCDPAGE